MTLASQAAAKNVLYDDIAGRYAQVDQSIVSGAALASNDIRSGNRPVTADQISAMVSVSAALEREGALREAQQINGSNMLASTAASMTHRVSDYRMPAPSDKPDPSQLYFVSTQEWDGYVTSIETDGFEGVIYPVGSSGDDFRADNVTVPWEMIDEGVRAKVRPGAIFRMAAGRIWVKRQVMHGVKIYFRLALPESKQLDVDRKSIEALFAD